MLGDDDLGATLIELGDDMIAVECLVGDQSTELDVLDKRVDANCVKALSRQENEVDKIPQRIG